MKYRFAEISQKNIFALLALFWTLGSNASLAAEVCDIDGNNRVEKNDIKLIFEARNRALITPFDPMDIDRNGVINTDDARICVCALPSTADCDAPLNQIPTANPGSDQTLIQASSITLDGSASSDPDGDLLNFLWAFQQRPENSQAVLSNANTVSPSFIPDQVGVYVLALTAADGYDASSTNSVTINVTRPIPSSLQAAADTNTAQAGGIVTGNITSNDVAGIGNTVIQTMTQNGQPLTFGAVFTTVSGGSLLVQADGSYRYTAPSSLASSMQEVFAYTVSDDSGASSDSTLTISVNPVVVPENPPIGENPPPVASNDFATATASGSAITGNVLGNDDLGNQAVNVTPVLTNMTTANGGEFSLQNDGSFTYRPPQGLEATIQEVFDYTITGTDGQQSSSTLTITVSVNPVVVPENPPIGENPPPVASNDFATATASGSAITGNVLGNDDLGNQAVNVTPVLTNMTTANGGEFSLQNDGSYTYRPPQGLEATIQEVFDYTITGTDGQQSSSTLTITVDPPNRLPVAQADTAIVNAGGVAISGNVLTNDELGNQPTQVTPIQTNLPTALGGVFSLQTNGSYTYTPPQSVANVAEEVIDYTITDTDGESSTSTLRITVNPERLQAVARPDVDRAIAGGAAIMGNVLENDDLGNQPTRLSGTVMNFQTQQGGIFSLAVDGSYTYMPPAAIAGVVNERFDYTITDKDGESSNSTLTIRVTRMNLIPLARPDTGSVSAGGTAITGNVLTNDDFGNEPTRVTPILVSRTENGGSLSLQAGGSYTYTPPATVTGVVSELFTYTITDNDAETSNSTLTITINPPSLTPVCRPDENNVTAGNVAITGNVLMNDDRGNEPTQVTPIDITGTHNGGALNIQANGNYTYRSPETVTGIVIDNFTYTVTDNDGESCESTLAITLSPANLIPLARPDSITVSAGGDVVSGDVLSNDDLGNEPVSVIPIVDAGTDNGGLLNLLANGTFTYTPPSIVKGVVTDRLTYTMTDNDGESSSSTLTITINTELKANADSNQVKAGFIVSTGGSIEFPTSSIARREISGNVMANDFTGVTPTVVLTPVTNQNTSLEGIFTLTSDGNYNYVAPEASRVQSVERIPYTIQDSEGRESSAILTIIVNPDLEAINDANKVMAGRVFVSAGQFSFFRPRTVTGNVMANDRLGTQPTVVNALSISRTQLGGSFNLQSDGSYSYAVPTEVTSEQQETITYTITDSEGDSSSATLTITVTPELRAIADSNSSFGGVVTGNVLNNDLLGSIPTQVTAYSITKNGASFQLLSNGRYSYDLKGFSFSSNATSSGPDTAENITFDYTITDNDGNTSTSTLTITVTIIG